MYHVICPNVLGIRPSGPVCAPGVPMGPTTHVLRSHSSKTQLFGTVRNCLQMFEAVLKGLKIVLCSTIDFKTENCGKNESSMSQKDAVGHSMTTLIGVASVDESSS